MQEDDDLKLALGEKLMPAIIDYLFEYGHLPLEKNVTMADARDVIQQTQGLLDTIINSIGCRFSIYDELVECIHEALVKDRKYSAIVLAGTCIEHIINDFYIKLLSRKYDMDSSDINSAMKLLGIKDKFTWFLKIITDIQIDQNLLCDVLSIHTLRNTIVHYKSFPVSFDELDGFALEKLLAQHEHVIKNTLSIISQLQEFCDMSEIKLFPSKRKAEEVLNSQNTNLCS